MKIRVRYAAQAREAAGRDDEAVELDSAPCVRDLVCRLAEQHGDPLRRLLLNGTGAPHPSLLVFVGDERVRCDDPRLLRAEDEVVIMTPIAGG